MLLVPEATYDRERGVSPNHPASSHKASKPDSLAASSASSRHWSRVNPGVWAVRSRCDTAIGSISNASRKVSAAVYPPAASTPDRLTVVMSLLCLGTFIVFCAVAAKFPNDMVYVTFLAFGATMFAGLLCRVVCDCLDSGGMPYNRNTGNTVLTVLLTLATITCLFGKQWYPALNIWVLQLSSETVTQISFPAVTVFQDDSHRFAANLVTQPWTCWIGDVKDDDAPACDTLSSIEVAQLGSRACNCSSYYHQAITTVDTKDMEHKVISFQPGPNLVASDTSTFLNLEIAFDYDTSNYRSSAIGSPNLWLSLYDPNLSADQAFNASTASITPIDASGETTVMLNLDYYSIRAQPSRYVYAPDISTNPYRNLPCDVANGNESYTPCLANVHMRFTGLQRTVYNEHPKMAWSDVAVSAGSYFALIQFVSWVFSGLAWTTS